MGGIPRYILRAVGYKGDLDIENVSEDEQEVVVYEGDNDINYQELKELESASKKSIAEKSIELEEEILVDD